MKGRILLVDDDLEACRFLVEDVGRKGWQAAACTSASEAFQKVGEEDWDVVLTDLNMPGMNGIELCERVAANRPDIPVVVLTAFGSLSTAVSAIRAGAYDFISKPFEIESVLLVLDRAVQHRRLREEVRRLRTAASSAPVLESMLGESTTLRSLADMTARIAASDASVLVTGESGTGKELVARAIHRYSRRREGPFVAINCAAIPESLLESELFGREKGAYTDAHSAQKGLFTRAEKGTLFLDEIGDMPLGLQAKVLRALEDRKVRPVGGSEEIPFDMRLVCSTHRDLETAVEQGRFREDLFFRINVVHLEVPPLRARGNDVLLLAQQFLKEFAAREAKHVAGIAAPAAERLLAYAWPGNVRELRNCVERAVALTAYEQIVVEDLPEKIRNYRPTQLLIPTENPQELLPMEEVERRYILRVLESVGGNKSVAARVLGFDRKTLYRKLEQYGVGDLGEDSEALAKK